MTWNLFRHHYGRLPVDDKMLQMGIGVDPNGFKPLSFEQIREHMATKKFAPINHRK